MGLVGAWPSALRRTNLQSRIDPAARRCINVKITGQVKNKIIRFMFKRSKLDISIMVMGDGSDGIEYD